MDSNIYVTSYIERKELQKRHGLEQETFVDSTIGYDGSVWLLFAHSVPDRINGMFVDTEANTVYTALCLWVNWEDGTLLGEEKYPLGFHKMNFHYVMPLGEDILLVGARCMRYKDGTAEKNGVLLKKDGAKLSEMCLGDGIESCIVTEDGRMITGYFDEGVFGNFGWNQPVGACGLIVWDAGGNKLWENTKYPIYDCYAMNVDEQGALWFYYYSEYQLVKTDFRRDVIYRPKEKGCTAFLINRSHTALIMDGGYGKHSQFFRYEVKGERLGRRTPADVIFREKPLLLSSYRFRGAKAVMTDPDGRMFFTEVVN